MDETRKVEEFERLLEGAGGIADDELAGLMLLARGVAASPAAQRAQAPVMRPDFREALRSQLVQQASGTVPLALHRRVRASVQARNTKMRRSFRSVVAIAAAMLVMLVGGSVLAAAQNAVPGDALYGVKTARENLALKAVFGRVPHAGRELDLARERLAEIKILADRGVGDAQLYVGALQNMDARTLDATKLLITEFRDTKNSAVLRPLVDFAAAQRQGLQAIADAVPPAARPKTRSSIELVSAVQNRVSDVLGGCPCPAEVLTPTANAAAGTPGRVSCGCSVNPGTSPGTGGTTSSPSAQKPGTTPPTHVTDPSTAPSGPVPPVSGTGEEQQVNTIINGLLSNLGVPSPAASPVATPSAPTLLP
jgi:Domain of unknown function (DUF5667)